LIARHSFSTHLPDEELTAEFVAKRKKLNAKQQELFDFHLTMINYALERGYLFTRWQTIANTILFKDLDTISSSNNCQHQSVRRTIISIEINAAVPSVTTMTETAAGQPNLPLVSLPLDNDNLLGFLLKDWKDFPDIDIDPEHLPETQNDRVTRIYEETVQRQVTTPTAWYRFATLGRNFVPYITFEKLWTNFDHD
jgi:hypothetical protein